LAREGSIDNEVSIEAAEPTASKRGVLTSGSVRIGKEKIIAGGRRRIQAWTP